MDISELLEQETIKDELGFPLEEETKNSSIWPVTEMEVKQELFEEISHEVLKADCYEDHSSNSDHLEMSAQEIEKSSPILTKKEEANNSNVCVDRITQPYSLLKENTHSMQATQTVKLETSNIQPDAVCTEQPELGVSPFKTCFVLITKLSEASQNETSYLKDSTNCCNVGCEQCRCLTTETQTFISHDSCGGTEAIESATLKLEMTTSEHTQEISDICDNNSGSLPNLSGWIHAIDPVFTQTKRNCKFCYRKEKIERKTKVMCKACNTYLCFHGGRNCLSVFHRA